MTPKEQDMLQAVITISREIKKLAACLDKLEDSAKKQKESFEILRSLHAKEPK